MSARGHGRNDPCPCGSGKKYKKCCNPRTFPDLTKPNAGLPHPLARPPAPRFFRRPPPPPPGDRPMTIDTVEVGVTRLTCAAIAPYGDGADIEGTLAPPTPEQVYAKYDAIRGGNPDNPTEIVVTYTYPEESGFAETRIVFDADECFLLPDGRAVSTLDLHRGMQVCTTAGLVATVVGHPERRYGIPEPPERTPDGRWLSRVMGRVKHTSYEIIEFRWAGQMVRVTPGHLVWSADRRGWVCAIELVPGERVIVSGNVPAPVEGPGRLHTGKFEVYGIEVEYFHNYFVGTGDDAMLVHNGPRYLDKLKGLEQAHPDLPVRTGGRTLGLIDGKPVVSGKAGGIAQEVFGPKMDKLSDAAKIATSHVEGYAAAEMVKGKLSEAVLFINYATGPCKYCKAGVAELLEAGQKLWVVFPRGVGFFTKGGWTKL